MGRGFGRKTASAERRTLRLFLQNQGVVFRMGLRPEHDVMTHKKEIPRTGLVPGERDHAPNLPHGGDKMSGADHDRLVVMLSKNDKGALLLS